MMKNERIHSSLLGLVGAYLFYLAWHLWELRGEEGANMQPWLRILFVILFLICGVAVLVYAGMLWRREHRAKDDEENEKEEKTE